MQERRFALVYLKNIVGAGSKSIMKNIVEQDSERKVLKRNSVLHERYVIQDVMGIGGFGVVYLAEDTDKSSKVAVKEYFPYGKSYRMDSSKKIVLKNMAAFDIMHRYALFENEAAILKKVSGFFETVLYKDFFYENATVYIIMEYINGITLQNWIKCNSKLELIQCFELLKPIMSCMASIHKMGIIHRDICPENIIVSENLKCHIIDFGAAIDLTQDNCREILESTYRSGYSPPEQYKYGGLIDESSDIYSIMATIYYCLTGHKPPNALERIHNDIFLEEGFLEIAERLKKIFRKGMALKNKNRYKTMELLMDEMVGSIES